MSPMFADLEFVLNWRPNSEEIGPLSCLQSSKEGYNEVRAQQDDIRPLYLKYDHGDVGENGVHKLKEFLELN